MAEDAQPEGPREDEKTLLEELKPAILRVANGEVGAKELENLESALRIMSVAKDAEKESLALEAKRSDEKLERTEARLRELTGAWAEGLKLRFEAYKTLTTLDSAALVAFAVITRNLFTSPAFLDVLRISYVLVLISLLASLIMMFIVGMRVTGVLGGMSSEEGGSGWRFYVLLIDSMSVLCFSFGLLLFLWFLSLNL